MDSFISPPLFLTNVQQSWNLKEFADYFYHVNSFYVQEQSCSLYCTCSDVLVYSFKDFQSIIIFHYYDHSNRTMFILYHVHSIPCSFYTSGSQTFHPADPFDDFCWFLSISRTPLPPNTHTHKKAFNNKSQIHQIH